MSIDIKRTRLSDGVNFTQICDDKFKTNRISITLVAPLRDKTAASYAVLPFILRRGFRACPDPAEFSRLLSSLYGAACDYGVKKAGDDQLLTISLSAIDDRFTLGGEKITAEISKILCSLILDPVIENGSFPKNSFETEKQSLIDSIKAELNDKVALAGARCQQIMLEGHSAAISRFGSLESAEALDCEEVFDAYNELLKKARIEILFIGSGDSEVAMDIFASSFSASAEREKPFDTGSSTFKPFGGIKDVTEKYNISQGKLSMGFSCDTVIGDEDESAMEVMRIILGGAPFSKLFLNVREKHSLCYYCSASYDRFKGTILINSGIEKENLNKAKTEILRQLEDMQNGEVSDEEIENARRLIRNVYTGISDGIFKTEQFLLPRLIAGKKSSPQSELEALCAVTKEDIINAARKVSLNTVYFMSPKEEA